MRRRSALGAGLVVAITLAACAGSDGPDRGLTPTVATTAVASRPNDAGCRYLVASTHARRTPAPPDPLLLTEAVATAEPCWDRMTFTFAPTGAGRPPGYVVEYRDPPFTEGPRHSPVETLGTAFLVVEMRPAASVGPGGDQAYRGNLRLLLHGMHHTQLVRKLVDADQTVSWIIGLDERRPFTVDSVDTPPRVSVLVTR